MGVAALWLALMLATAAAQRDADALGTAAATGERAIDSTARCGAELGSVGASAAAVALARVAGPARSVPYTPAAFVVDALQPGTAFHQQSASGAVAFDPEDTVRGDTALRIDTDGDAGQVNVRAANVGPFDLRETYLRVAVKIDQPARLEHVLLYLSSDGFAGYQVYRLVRGGTAFEPWVLGGAWQYVTLALGSPLEVVGAGADLGSITDLQLSVADLGSGPVQVRFGALEALPRPARGVVTIVFDDARDGVYRFARPVLERYGVRAAVAVIADLVGQPGFMRLEELQNLERFAGWEVIAHHATVLPDGTGLTALDPVALGCELATIKSWLLTNGFQRGADQIAYPSGAFDRSTLEATRALFATGRTISRANGLETWPPADPLRIRALSVRSDDPPAALMAAVDRAEREHGWLTLVFHQIVDGEPQNATSYAMADFERVIRHLATADVDVRSPSDVADLDAYRAR